MRLSMYKTHRHTNTHAHNNTHAHTHKLNRSESSQEMHFALYTVFAQAAIAVRCHTYCYCCCCWWWWCEERWVMCLLCLLNIVIDKFARTYNLYNRTHRLCCLSTHAQRKCKNKKMNWKLNGNKRDELFLCLFTICCVFCAHLCAL